MTDILLREATFDDIVEELDKRSCNEGILVAQYGVGNEKIRGFTYKHRGCMARVLGWLTIIGDDIRGGYRDDEVEEDDTPL